MARESNDMMSRLPVARADRPGANRDLETIPAMDALAGIVNRRHFDEVMGIE